MSRCFPFPPPGYERKITTDSASLIIKEKHKQKKEKKDKEKKEGKSERHKDGKDRKEKKHRDKKHKKREKHKSSEEKKNEGSSENRNGEILASDGSKHNKEIEDSRVLVELGKRLRNDDGAVDLRYPKLVEKVEHPNDHKLTESCEDSVEKRDLENGYKAEDVAHKVDTFHKKKEENEKIKQRSNEIRGNEHKHERRDGQKTEDKRSSKEKKERNESIKEPIKQIGNKRQSVDFREPNGSLKKAEENRGTLRNHTAPESNGFLHVNGIQPNNIPKAVSYSHHQDRGVQNGSGSYLKQHTTNAAARKAPPSSNHVVNGKPVGGNVIIPEPGQRSTNNHLINKGFVVPSPHSGIGKKTESCQMLKDEQRIISNHGRANSNNHIANGFVPPQLLDTGKKTGPHRTPKVDENNFPSTENERKVTDPKIDEKDPRKNGGIKDEAKQQQASSKPSSASSSSSTKVKEKKSEKEKSRKKRSMKPHPDLKYLDRILTVPRADSTVSDDQEWLFGCSETPAKRPKIAAATEATSKEVWAEAMRLEPADVIALPYVIPY